MPGRRCHCLAVLAVALAALACSPVAAVPAPRLTDMPSATLPPPTIAPPPTILPTNLPTAAPSPPAAPTPASLFTFTIMGGEYGYLVIAVAAGAACGLTNYYPEGEVQKLETKTAGADGKLDWRWPQTVRPEGIAHSVVACALGGKSDTESIDWETVN